MTYLVIHLSYHKTIKQKKCLKQTSGMVTDQRRTN